MKKETYPMWFPLNLQLGTDPVMGYKGVNRQKTTHQQSTDQIKMI